MNEAGKRGRPPTYPNSTAKESEIDNISYNIKYKKYTPDCSFNCGWCSLLGRSIIEQMYKDFGNILLEDDSKLSFNFFGREVVK